MQEFGLVDYSSTSSSGSSGSSDEETYNEKSQRFINNAKNEIENEIKVQLENGNKKNNNEIESNRIFIEQEFRESTKNNADSNIIKSKKENSNLGNTQSIQSIDSTYSIDKIDNNEKNLKRKREVIESNVKSKKLPPLPPEFLELYQDDERKKSKKYLSTIPSPIKSIPQSHKNIEGDWATHVYMEVTIPDEFTELLRKIEKSVQNVILDDDIYSCIDEINEDLSFKNSKLHISLSRPIFLKYFQIDKFWDKLKKGFEDQKRFTLSFSGIEYLVNDAKTKSFLTLEVGKGIYELKRLLEHVNKVAKEFRQQEFYEKPRFHASILWSVGESTIDRTLRDIIIKNEVYESIIRDFVFVIERMVCGIGNKSFFVDLI
ncbi:hypothetical protein Glove_709g76 [Diversispora epigaea]|uniref:U6 snRNA phosphodiesterase 1 n=1 Tax=Diversispora epigaea TaxID=1348612 RepID=A0A397G1C5_9GLOM|nr:hypothetical protein Glove_709g76 [Diversispora epigaea]